MKLSSIREPQLERTPWVQKMSFWAMGMPVSGVASACASRMSAWRAAANASSSVTVMKAFSSASSDWIRVR